MKRLFRSLALCTLGFAPLAPATLAQGPGPGIQPTPISSLPFTISLPGAYYLTTSLTGVTGADGIRINASNVSLNLNGHRLRGVPGSLNGIKANGVGRVGITVMNGTISEWGQQGIEATIARRLHVEGVLAMNCGASGIRVGSDAVVLRCQAELNGADGISAAMNASIDGCVVVGNASFGISTGQRCQVAGCVATENGQGGVTTSSECEVTNTVASANQGVGILADGSSVVTSCTTARNSSHGIEVSNRCRVMDCTSTFNGNGTNLTVAGIRAKDFGNFVEGNHSNSNGIGIELVSTFSFVTRNTSLLETAAFVIPAGNFAGPIVTQSGLATLTNPAANFDL